MPYALLLVGDTALAPARRAAARRRICAGSLRARSRVTGAGQRRINSAVCFTPCGLTRDIHCALGSPMDKTALLTYLPLTFGSAPCRALSCNDTAGLNAATRTSPPAGARMPFILHALFAVPPPPHYHVHATLREHSAAATPGACVVALRCRHVCGVRYARCLIPACIVRFCVSYAGRGMLASTPINTHWRRHGLVHPIMTNAVGRSTFSYRNCRRLAAPPFHSGSLRTCLHGPLHRHAACWDALPIISFLPANLPPGNACVFGAVWRTADSPFSRRSEKGPLTTYEQRYAAYASSMAHARTNTTQIPDAGFPFATQRSTYLQRVA